jgi:glycerol-3-phosphate dehydrogenase
MAEETVDQLIKWLNELNPSTSLKAGYAECRTAKEPLLPATEVAGLSSILPPELSRPTVEHYVKSEWAVHLDDVMLRRTGWHYYYADAGKMAKQVADWMGELMSWSADVRAGELERYLNTTGPQAYRTIRQKDRPASEPGQGPTAYGR